MRKIDFSSLVSPLLIASAGLLPIFFLPLTSDLFDINKRFLFFVVTLLAVVLGAIQLIIKKELRFTRTPWTFPVALFGLSTIATLVLISPNKIQALTGSGGLYIAFTLLFLIGSSLIRKNITSPLLTALSFAGALVTLTSLLGKFGINITGILNSAFSLAVPAGTPFHITGSPLFSVFFLSLVTLMLGIRVYQTRGTQENVLHAIFAVICVVGIGVNALSLLPGSPTSPQFLSLLNSWSISTDVLKTPLNAVLGIGTDSYANAFSIFKPVRMNESPLWFVRFNNARNSVLELLTTQGVLGMTAWVLILLATLRVIKSAKGEHAALGAGVLFIEAVLLLFPPNVILMSLLCILLIAWTGSLKERDAHVKETVFSFFSFTHLDTNVTSKTKGIVTQIAGVLTLLVTAAAFYLVGRAYAGEYFFNRSLVSASQGDGRSTYDNGIKALTLNPYMENYHRAFALTNLSLAQAISENKEITDQDKQNVLTLIQQAIAQAKIATVLDPLNTANWETLTTVYQALIGTADGAHQWTTASYVEQIKTDPSNPAPRFSMGTMYRQIGNDDQALKLFEQAVQLKSDYANAYFNMADIYKKKGDKQSEFAMLQATLSLITPEQNGYQTVKSRYDELQAELAKPESDKKAAPTPTPKPTPSPTPEVTLSGDSGLTPTGSVPEVPAQ